jgi:hypothetical protein
VRGNGSLLNTRVLRSPLPTEIIARPVLTVKEDKRMRSGKLLSVVGLAAALAVSGFGSQVVAQSGLIIGGSRSNFGSRNIAPGFLPDPININVVSGGNIDARGLGLGPGCVGWVTRQPDFIVHMTGNSPSLRMYVTSDADTTLLVNTARSQWVCNDDSYGGTNPTVDMPSAGAGQYDIWIGSYQNGVQARGVLHITELGGNHP